MSKNQETFTSTRQYNDGFVRGTFNWLRQTSAKHPVFMLGATALYFLSPVDASVVDAFPPITYIDDAFVAAAFLSGLSNRKNILKGLKQQGSHN